MIRECQNCKATFEITSDDMHFYDRIKVPPPTWCPECALIRRLLFRSGPALYRKKEALHGKEIISMYAPDSPFKVYDQKIWWSDQWDPLQYGREYDFFRPFFPQLYELMCSVPWPALINWNSVNSDYCNYSTDNKNCYLISGGDFNEDCAYGTHNIRCKDSYDLYYATKLELGYQCIDSDNCYKVFFSRHVENCRESAFLFDCINCEHCIGCVNLRNRSYCILNRQYTKEEYEKRVREFDLGSFSGLALLQEKFLAVKLSEPHRFAQVIKTTRSTGDNLRNTKNCTACFDAYDDIEDSKDLFIGVEGVRDVMRSNLVGYSVELLYESFTAFSGSSRVLCSGIIQSSHDIQYCFNVSDACAYLFGCVGLRKKQYCILNKQYSKEEYEALVPRIIQHMREMPYKDKVGMVYAYGEFTPPEFSPFAYNESKAQDYFPLTKEGALQKGYAWKDPEKKTYTITLESGNLPDHIRDVPDSILAETIGCAHEAKCNEQCTTAFKIIPQELEFYRKLNLPLPRLCPNCRHYQRLKQRNPLRLWHRKCTCGGEKSENGIYQNQTKHFHGRDHCSNEFETSYAPERPEIVYCEQCYQTEVV